MLDINNLSFSMYKKAKKKLFDRRIIVSECWFHHSGSNIERMSPGRVCLGKGILFGAHRISYVIFKEKIRKGFMVCHKCDNPPCFRPSHLFAGTQLDNMSDCARKNRIAYGNNHGIAKLTEANVRLARKLYRKGNAHSGIGNILELCKKFEVSRRVLLGAIYGESWRRVI